MSHTIPESSKISNVITPLALYEGNYRRVLKLFPELLDANEQGNSGGLLYAVNDDSIQLKIIEQHKYTSIIKLTKFLLPSGLRYAASKNREKSAQMDLRICFDANLVEVISFQGSQPLKTYRSYPNKEMLLPDEKKQLNLHLKNILELSIDCISEHNTSNLIVI